MSATDDRPGAHLREPAAVHRPLPRAARPATPAGSVTSSCMRVPVPTGAATSSNPMLQRIYGTAWASKKDLRGVPHTASRRPRSAITASWRPSSTCLSFPEKLGGGLALWHPKGAMVRKLMEDYSRERHEHGGYEFVYSPHIARSTCGRRAGTWASTRTRMYPPMEMDSGRYYPKPMNCPFHILIYQSRAAQLPRPAASGSSSSARSTATSSPARCTA